MQEGSGLGGREVLAERIKERGAMVGVSWECCHQSRCVFCELETRIDVLLLILLLWDPESTLLALAVSVVRA